MHGLAAIGAAIMLLIWGPLLWSKLKATPRTEWLHDQPLLVTSGLLLDSIGVFLISAYRTAQMLGSGVGSLANEITNIALGFLVAGTTMLIRSASLNGAKWKWRLYLVCVASWLLFAWLFGPWIVARLS